MSYFKHFPIVSYPIQKDDGSVEYILMKDISRNVRFIDEILQQITLFDEYDIQDGDTPDIISYKLYGTQYYHWVIMLLNHKFNFWQDFPLQEQELLQMCIRKYGEEHLNDQKQLFGMPMWLDPDGNIVDQPLDGDIPNYSLVTNYDYEIRQNEKKRKIKVLDKVYIEQIQTEFKNRLIYG